MSYSSTAETGSQSIARTDRTHVHAVLAFGLVSLGALIWSVSSEYDVDRASLLLLALYSAGLLVARCPGSGQRVPPHALLILTGACLLFAAAVLFSVPKGLMLGSALLLTAGLTLKKSVGKTNAVCITVLASMAVPLPAAWAAEVSVSLANFQAMLVEFSLEALGFTVDRVGAQLRIGSSLVTINRACSGFPLIAPVMMGLLTALRLSRRSTVQMVPFGGAVLFSVLLLNSLRILLATWLTAEGEQSAFNLYHDLSGAVLMMVGWGLPILVWVRDVPLAPASDEARVLVVTATLLLALSSSNLLAGDKREALQPPRLPQYLDGWVAAVQNVQPSEVEILGTRSVERSLYSRSFDTGERLVTLMTFRTLKKAMEHTSYDCFRATGWTVDRLPAQQLLDGTPVTVLEVNSLTGRQFVYEVFQPAGDHFQRLQVVQRSTSDETLLVWMGQLLDGKGAGL